MKIMRLVFMILASVFTFVVYSSTVIAQDTTATKKESKREYLYDSLVAFLRQSREIDTDKLHKITSTIITKPEEVKTAIAELDAMEKDLESDVSNLKDCIEKVKAGNYVFIDTRRLPGTTKIETELIIKDDYIDLLHDIISNRQGTGYLEKVDTSTDYIKRDASQLIGEIENFIEEVKKQKSYYIDQLTKPPIGLSQSENVTTTPATLEPIKKDALVFIAEVIDAESNRLVENATVTLMLCKAKERRHGISKKTTTTAEASSGSAKFHLTSLFNDKTFATVDTYSGRAKFTIPADTLANICSVEASHPKYENAESNIDQKLLVLSTEPRRFVIYLKPKKEEPQSQPSSFEWQLTKTTEDPDKKTGVAIGGYNVCDALTKSSATIHNDKLPGTRTSVQASADIPQTLKPNQKFNITMSVSCTTEGEYCCIDAGVATDGIECTPAKRVGGCSKSSSKSITESQVYECTAPKSQYYDKLAVAPFVGGLGQMARYEYTEKKLIEYQPGSSSSSSKESTASNTVSQALPSPIIMPTVEQDTDRPGMDYTSFDLSEADPIRCQNACAMDTNCKAYTYVRPGVQGPKARCWLKTGVPSSRKDNCCISGTKP